MGISLALTGLLLIPTSILIVLIHFTWEIADRIIRWCETGGNDDL